MGGSRQKQEMLRSPSLEVVSGLPPLLLSLLEVKQLMSSKSDNIRGEGTYLQWSRAWGSESGHSC